MTDEPFEEEYEHPTESELLYQKIQVLEAELTRISNALARLDALAQDLDYANARTQAAGVRLAIAAINRARGGV